MSFQDSAFIFFIALLLFGPKKLPELARQLGKLMGEFRRASNEFRMQLEDELRTSEQAEKQKKIVALEAATPAVTTLPAADLTASSADVLAPHPHEALSAPAPLTSDQAELSPENSIAAPIATAGDLHLHPPATGLPVSRNGSAAASVSQAFDSIPEAPPDRSQPTELDAVETTTVVAQSEPQATAHHA